MAVADYKATSRSLQSTAITNKSCYGLIENFEIEKQIGKGQFSEVFRAKCMIDNRTVALKRIKIYELMDMKAREECSKEIELLKQLNHPNVIQYLSSFIHENDLFIVLELADAGDLSKMIKYFKKEKRLIPEKTVWKYFLQISSALQHMHIKRVMHRDLKPANIFLTVQGTVKLGDLGLSRFFGNSTMITFSLVGTPYYMSPERIKECGYGENMNLQMLVQKIEICNYPQLAEDMYSYEMRNLVHMCLNLDPLLRPDINEIVAIATKMHTNYQALGHTSPMTPSPADM